MKKMHLFERIDLIFNKFKNFDLKTINDANELKKEIINTFVYFQKKELIKIELESKKRLICFELFGKIPYNYRILTIEFLMWYFVNYKEIEENILFWQMQYETFINCFKREPNNFNDLIRFEKLTDEQQLKYYDENHKIICIQNS